MCGYPPEDLFQDVGTTCAVEIRGGEVFPFAFPFPLSVVQQLTHPPTCLSYRKKQTRTGTEATYPVDVATRAEGQSVLNPFSPGVHDGPMVAIEGNALTVRLNEVLSDLGPDHL